MSADVAAAVGVPSSLDFGVSRVGCVRDSCGRALRSCRAQWVWDRSRWHLGDWTSGSASLGSIFSFVCWVMVIPALMPPAKKGTSEPVTAK